MLLLSQRYWIQSWFTCAVFLATSVAMTMFCFGIVQIQIAFQVQYVVYHEGLYMVTGAIPLYASVAEHLLR